MGGGAAGSEGMPAVNEVESRTFVSSHDSSLFVEREEQDQVKPWTRILSSERSSHLPPPTHCFPLVLSPKRGVER